MEVQNGDNFNGIQDLWEIIEGIKEAPSSCVDANMKKAYKNRVEKICPSLQPICLKQLAHMGSCKILMEV